MRNIKRRKRKKNDINYKIVILSTFLVIIFGVIIFSWSKSPSSSKVKMSVEIGQPIKVEVDGNVVEMDMEEYISHVVSGEMYASYDMEALKAQAVTARTYTYYKLSNSNSHKTGANICDDINHCQAYKNEVPQNIIDAVDATQNEIMTYKGAPIIALFHSTSGGKTEDNVNVFGQNLPYLKSVESEGEEQASTFSKRETFSIATIKTKLKENYSSAKSDSINVVSRYDSGRVEKVDLFGVTLTGKQTRELLGLASANFSITIEGNKVHFDTIGYGHGVGLSQVGANAMAMRGYHYKDILLHYYSGVKIESAKKLY